jgi:hypothetical protein
MDTDSRTKHIIMIFPGITRFSSLYGLPFAMLLHVGAAGIYDLSSVF